MQTRFLPVEKNKLLWRNTLSNLDTPDIWQTAARGQCWATLAGTRRMLCSHGGMRDTSLRCGGHLYCSLWQRPPVVPLMFSCKAASHSGLRFKPGCSLLLTWSYDTVVICSWCVSGFACKCHWCRMPHGFGGYCWWYKPCQEESEQYGQRAGTIQQRDRWEPGQLLHPCVPLPALRGLGSIACVCQEACVQTMFKGFLNSVLSKGNAIVFNSWIKMSGFCL